MSGSGEWEWRVRGSPLLLSRYDAQEDPLYALLCWAYQVGEEPFSCLPLLGSRAGMAVLMMTRVFNPRVDPLMTVSPAHGPQ